MKLWTIQPVTVYQHLIIEGVFRCTPSMSICITEMDFSSAYDWMAEQMRARIGEPPPGVQYPIWAWHTLSWEHKQPDLRRIEFRGYKKPMVCLEIEIPDSHVLLSDEEAWHSILNDGYLGCSKNEAEYEAEAAWFDSLPEEQQAKVKRKSWERIFDIDPPVDNGWDRIGMYIQATFWELRLEQVKKVRRFSSKEI